MSRTAKIFATVAVAGLAVSACGGNASGGADDSSSGGGTLVIGVDLPLQGASKDASEATVNAMQLYLDQTGSKAGKYKVKLKVYDDSTAAKGAWDDATCAKNAQDHVGNTEEVAVMGTYNSGCAQIIAPVLNQDPTGPMLMVSHANTNPGLTKAWDSGEPEKYFPSGKRSYARVIATDDYQGAAGAQFAAKDLSAKKCYILNDNQTYGQGVGKAFEEEAKKQGIKVLGNQAWDVKQPNYTALFTSIKSTNPDCVYLAGIFDNNGGQLVKDKVKVLGDNSKVKLIAPDGFSGYPEFDGLAQAQGAYITFAGLTATTLREDGGPGAKLLDAYKKKYGADPATSYALYGVEALQVIMQAIEKSDGTRKSITEQVFSGSGISIPADKSIVGKKLDISPKTGDVSVRDISVLQLKDKEEKFLKPWPVS
ncbi:branched-chain amino acid ABC transporter substrate-binding protein [Streptomyces sporangiiformans]|uniref:Amino acid ABC transporter substrate-binding protein n=1 Tax=Streptomyces sporangiiformans TaxID=2315329 RepID=A0A505DP19_9ACTN|nr:branched-chain amino acid ABC transporter substrate-binding protein [Streptomyces sporangiiformans]TPQ22910.1 amino acid ABC transporter substrate-binding protein [Streptomyces sporangiiformans]